MAHFEEALQENARHRAEVLFEMYPEVIFKDDGHFFLKIYLFFSLAALGLGWHVDLR